MLQTVKAIKNLEIASVCNLACPYCPCRLQGEHRDVGLMTEEVFERSLYWLKKFVAASTQEELNFFGVGESLLHPHLVEWVRRTRDIMPRYLPLLINTNGILFTEEIGRALYDAGTDKIDLTDHEAEASTRTIIALRKISGHYHPIQKDPASPWGYSRDGVMAPNNWGGLVDWVPEVQHPRYLCPWLSKGQVMIMSSGDVTRCCQDAFGRGIIGSVWEEVGSIPYGPYVQCVTCHEIVPDFITQTEKEAV